MEADCWPECESQNKAGVRGESRPHRVKDKGEEGGRPPGRCYVVWGGQGGGCGSSSCWEPWLRCPLWPTILGTATSCGTDPALTKPPQGSGDLRLLVVVSAHCLHLGPLMLHEVLLAVEVLGPRPPPIGHRAVLAHIAVVAQELLPVVVVSVHLPKVLRPVDVVAQAPVLDHEIPCGQTRSALREVPDSGDPGARDLTPRRASGWDDSVSRDLGASGGAGGRGPSPA